MAKTFEPKEHIWYLEVDGEEKIFKCLVTETECVTYEGDTERKHLKIMNPVRKDKVLQIDTITSIYGQQIPFQLENGVPYIKWDGGWKMSETNRQDRIAQGIRVNKLSAWIMISAGILCCAATAILYFILGASNMGQWWLLAFGGVAVLMTGCMNLSRLRVELEALKEAEEEEAKEKAARLGH